MTDAPRVISINGSPSDRKKVLDKIIKQYEGFDIHRYDSSISLAYLDQQVGLQSCFSDKKLIILSDLPQFTGARPTFLKNMKKLLDSIPDDVLLIFNNIKDTALLNHIESIGKSFSFAESLQIRPAVHNVIAWFSEIGKTISEEVAETLVQSCGYDSVLKGFSVEQLKMAVRKIHLYTGKIKTITNDDVIINSFGTEEFVIWQILNAIDERSFEKVISVYERYIFNENSVKEAVEKLLPMLLNKFKLLLFLKEGLAKQMSKSDLTKEALELKKIAKEETKSMFTENVIKSSLEGIFGRKPTVSLYQRAEISKSVYCLQKCILQARGTQSEERLQLIMNVALLAICSKVDISSVDKLLDF